MATKSDVAAKEAYLAILRDRGFDAKIQASPADIIATKAGETWYFEIKSTSQTDKYFGAATLTEWEQALKTPDRYFFVVAKMSANGTFEFQEYTPQEFMTFSTIPPFKIFFNIDFRNKSKKQTKQNKRKAIHLSPEKFHQMLQLFNSFREES